ncbi:c-type cytochrome biogenesis protein CcmI [Roseovarius sp. EL26]|uniref:c-type cytochrome biogenesis protein CcmI n=1 Tax=Roseovarius sp. EL26 TaxID=2126672 RepID=UPI000EA3A66E|nr:c-type cytochrome biogenesis protein CcmI [Roseovarius sp. EL26]
MFFWITFIGLALVTGLYLLRSLFISQGEAQPDAANDLKIYRDQLKEIERDTARGTLPKDEAERARVEVSRRLLAADTRLQAETSSIGPTPTANRLFAGSVIMAFIGAAVALYAMLGAPGYGDQSLESRLAASDNARSARLDQVQAETRASLPTAPEISADYQDLIQKLRDTVAERPGDLQGLRLLVQNEATLGNLVAAHAAQAQVITVKGPQTTAEDYTLWADLMISAAGGYVSSDAEQALRLALERDPSDPRARYYLGLFLIQVDRPDSAFRLWEQLLTEGPADAQWIAPISSRIEELAWRAGVEYKVPTTTPLPGPDADAISAAQGLSDDDRQDMIQSMVNQLSDRLASEGGSPEEWARLIRALGVLGDTDQARMIWQEAQNVFEQTPTAISTLRAAARDAGVTQ